MEKDVAPKARKNSRNEAWRSMIARYSAASEDDWATFALPESNRSFYNWPTRNPDDLSSQERVVNWLKAKSGRKCVVILTDRNNARDYLRSSREQIQRDYSDPERRAFLEECDARFRAGSFGKDDNYELYFMTPEQFDAYAREQMGRRAARAKLLAERMSRLGRDASPEDVLKASDENNESDESEKNAFSFKFYEAALFSAEDYKNNGFDFGDDWSAETKPKRPEIWFRQFYLGGVADDSPKEARFFGDPSWTSALPEKGFFRERVKLVPEEGTETLLTLGETPLVCRRRVGEGEVLLINSSSFLSNYGLTDPVNRKIAARVVREFNPDGNVGFLISSGFFYEDDADSPEWKRKLRQKEKGRFSLLKVSSFSVLAWHAAFLAMLAGFCAWPIFGRARRVDRDESSDFGLHIEATANMLKRSNSVAWAFEQIDLCRKLRGRDRFGTAKDEPLGASAPNDETKKGTPRDL